MFSKRRNGASRMKVVFISHQFLVNPDFVTSNELERLVDDTTNKEFILGKWFTVFMSDKAEVELRHTPLVRRIPPK